MLYWCIAPDYELCKVQYDLLLGVFPPDLIKKAKNTKPYKIELWDGTIIDFKTGEKPERLVGNKLFGTWIDEWARCKYTIWHNLRPCLSDYRGWCVGTSTPLGEDHWFDMWTLGDPANPNKDPEMLSLHFLTSDNPAIDPLEIAAARRQMTPEDFAINYEADFGTFVGKIYRTFQKRKHVVRLADIPAAKDRKYVWASADFGDTDALCVLVYILDFNNNVWVVDEYYSSQITFESSDPAQSTAIRKMTRLEKKWGIQEWYGDPAGKSFLRMMRAAGLNGVRKAKNDLWGGIVVCRTLLHNYRIFVVDECEQLIRQLNSYRKTDPKATKPDKDQEDHAVDSFRYGITAMFGTDVSRVIELRPGQRAA